MKTATMSILLFALLGQPPASQDDARASAGHSEQAAAVAGALHRRGGRIHHLS